MKSKKGSVEQFSENVQLPNGVTAVANVATNSLTIKGPLGEVTKVFKMPINLKVEGNSITISTSQLMFLNTALAHTKNMIKGVTQSFKKHFKVLYAHFPITIEVKGKDILIKNFLGEKKPRQARIIGNVKIDVKGKELTISSCNIEDLGQTIANIKSSLKIREKDSRVFQDGIYEVEQDE